MRTIIDLPDRNLDALDRLARRRQSSRAAVVRQAVDEFLARTMAEDVDQAFGIWRDRPVNALAHQRRLRGEWHR